MLTDLHVFDLDDMVLLDVPAQLSAATLQRLDRSLFSEDVQLSDLSHVLTSVWVHGPPAAETVQKVLAASAPDSWLDHQNERLEFGGGTVVLVRWTSSACRVSVSTSTLRTRPDLRRALEAAGAPQVHADTIATARVEAGYPVRRRYDGRHHSARSRYRGSRDFVHQEVLRGARGDYPRHASGPRACRPKAGWLAPRRYVVAQRENFAADREIGWVTSAASSPRLGRLPSDTCTAIL